VRSWLAADPPLTDDAIPFGGTDHNQAEVLRGVDGDTVRLHRRRTVAELESSDDLGSLVYSNWRVRVAEDDVLDLPDGLAARLVNLDTPELRSKDPDERARAKVAAADLWAWCRHVGDRLRCITYDQGGGFDRLLVDLYWIGGDGVAQSATEHMLSLGWSPYLGKAQRTAPRTVAD
jgi:endonuclease YncB( thermonuclease family)